MKFVKIRVLSNAKKFLHVLVILISYKQYNVYSHQQNNWKFAWDMFKNSNYYIAKKSCFSLYFIIYLYCRIIFCKTAIVDSNK